MNILSFILRNTRLNIILCLFCLNFLGLGSSQFTVLAQTDKSNPLENVEPAPLLTPQEIDRPLTFLEKKIITKKIISLNNQAQVQLAAGNQERAFTLWYRELRLQQALGLTEEITALGRVGAIAWQQNLTPELNVISDRLLAIKQQLTPEQNLDSQLLANLGKAYRQVKDLDRATAIYQQILQNHRQAKNLQAEYNTLETLGKLYLDRFDYIQAASIYEDLLKSAQTQHAKNNVNGDSYVRNNKADQHSQQTKAYLNQLALIYERLSQPAKAIEIKQQLIKQYLQEQNNEQLAALNISLAVDYQILKQQKQAQNYYEKAFELAWSLQQFALAEESLQKLALLYQEYQQPTAALQVYQELIKVHQKSYSYYNLMDTYSQIGGIYKNLGNYQQALNAYQQGLKIAQSFNYRVDYFKHKIEQLNKN